MKKASKILVALLALCLLMGALALAISADEPAPANVVTSQDGDNNAFDSNVLNASKLLTKADVTETSGNVYRKVTVKTKGTNVNDAIIYNQPYDGGNRILYNQEVVIVEFDFKNEGLADMIFVPKIYDSIPRYNADGSYLASTPSSSATTNIGPRFKLSNDQICVYWGGYAPETSELSRDVWHRITLVYDIVSTAKKMQIPAYSNATTVIPDTFVEKDVWDLSESRIHYYVDGQLVKTANFGTGFGYSGCLVADGKHTDFLYKTTIGTETAASVGQSIGFDNINISNYSKSYVSTHGIDFDSILYDTKSEIVDDGEGNLSTVEVKVPKATLAGNPYTNLGTNVNTKAAIYYVSEDGLTTFNKTTVDKGTANLPAYEAEGNVDTTPDYYSLNTTEWNADDITAATAGLAVGGQFNIRAVTEKVAPDKFPGLKVNFTLYSNYVMNVYVPADTLAEELNVWADEEMTQQVPVRDQVTINEVIYNRYSVIVGAADAENHTLYFDYLYEEGAYIYEFTYGVPAYARAVMEQYSENTAAKELVVNMANYADKVLKLTSAGDNVYSTFLAECDPEGTYVATYTNLAVGTASGATGTAVEKVANISFSFDTFAPTYVLTLTEAADVTVSYSGYNAVAVTPDEGVYVSYAGKDIEAQASLRLSKITNVTFTVGEGTVEYSLEAYINSLDAETEGAYINAAKALYAFAIEAGQYSAQ